jgi:hypothetical protein
MLTVVSVIGAVEGALVEEFVSHYRTLGVERFFIGVHLAPDTSVDREEETLEALRRSVPGGPAHVSRGPWLAGTNAVVRDRLRSAAGEGWHVVADADEFQQYPAPIPDLLPEYAATSDGVVEGLLFDRVAESGELRRWDPAGHLDTAYPLGGFFTATVVGGDPRKVVLARSEIRIGSGNHWAPGLRVGPARLPPIPVHHFKWRAGCREYLERRLAGFAASGHPEEISMAEECTRTLEHLRAHGGRIDVAPGNETGWVRSNLLALPADWYQSIEPIMEMWWKDRWSKARPARTTQRHGR